MARIEEKTNQRQSSTFDVASGGQHFCTVRLHSGPFKLGDTVQGFMEFPDALEGNPLCLQVLISVETVEDCLYSDTVKPHIHRHSYKNVTTVFMKHCHFRVTIPITAVPSFTEQAVRVTWRVRFEFTVTKDPILCERDDGESLAEDLNVQALSLDQPIFVHATNPVNVGMALHLKHSTPVIVV